MAHNCFSVVQHFSPPPIPKTPYRYLVFINIVVDTVFGRTGEPIACFYGSYGVSRHGDVVSARLAISGVVLLILSVRPSPGNPGEPD